MWWISKKSLVTPIAHYIYFKRKVLYCMPHYIRQNLLSVAIFKANYYKRRETFDLKTNWYWCHNRAWLFFIRSLSAMDKLFILFFFMWHIHTHKSSSSKKWMACTKVFHSFFHSFAAEERKVHKLLKVMVRDS